MNVFTRHTRNGGERRVDEIDRLCDAGKLERVRNHLVDAFAGRRKHLDRWDKVFDHDLGPNTEILGEPCDEPLEVCRHDSTHGEYARRYLYTASQLVRHGKRKVEIGRLEHLWRGSDRASLEVQFHRHTTAEVDDESAIRSDESALLS